MTDATRTTTAPAGFHVGDAIDLADLLALPPDGRRYGRDAEGRLTVMGPDDAPSHRWPMAVLHGWLVRELPPRWWVLEEPGIAFDPILSLDGTVLPPSRLGRRTLGPDLAVYEGRPQFLRGRPQAEDPRYQVFAPRGLRLAVELLSPRTHRNDLGLGSADEVDRWRTYLTGGVEEYWVLNAGSTECGIPPRSGLFLRNEENDRWEPLEGQSLRHGAEKSSVHELRPVVGGRIHSPALGRTLDLDTLWREVLDDEES